MELKNLTPTDTLTANELRDDLFWYTNLPHGFVPLVVKVGNEYRCVSGADMKALKNGQTVYVIQTRKNKKKG